MKLKYLYEMYDNGVKQGERTSLEWEELLSIPRQAIRDYAREGRSYKHRYTFKAVREENLEDKTQQEETEITVQDLREFRRSLKIGSKFEYEDSCKVIVVRKYRNIVELVSLKDPKRSVTMTYMELLKQQKNKVKRYIDSRG
ncbi:hypothetical protein [Lacrimispora xylanolytica]|uniref:Phage protein n=1 Tax=Lacrimispora xylanolytica TaxID=29375 RepID=A0ABY7AEU8_9FIRM|nr:hypothetical protein [Lacrimispora xylanolytica]WAJ24036.1 hypothetical protein OW255_00460 [Lacrimispora xylanolytica]